MSRIYFNPQDTFPHESIEEKTVDLETWNKIAEHIWDGVLRNQCSESTYLSFVLASRYPKPDEEGEGDACRTNLSLDLQDSTTQALFDKDMPTPSFSRDIDSAIGWTNDLPFSASVYLSISPGYDEFMVKDNHLPLPITTCEVSDISSSACFQSNIPSMITV
jgi:hypothetical protein